MRDRPNRRRYGGLWGPDPSREIRDELSFHIDMKERELRASGMPEDRLREETDRAFGDRTAIELELRRIGRRRLRRARRWNIVDDLRSDMVQAWRSLQRRPGVPALVVVTLALGVGAGTAVFSLFHAVVLDPVAASAPEDLYALYEGESGTRGSLGVSYPMLKLLRSRSTETRGLAAATQPMSVGVSAGDHVEQLSVGLATGNYFDVLGIRPQRGRLLRAEDEAAPGTTPYAVLSDALWRRAFGRDRSVVGRTIRMNEQPFTIVGVAASGFRGTRLSEPVDIWVPITMVRTIGRSGLFAAPNVLDTWSFSFLEPIARFPGGASTAAAMSELRALHRAGLEQAPMPPGPSLGDRRETTLSAVPLTEAAAGRSHDELLRFLAVLAAVVTICLLVACVNAANLLLMRSTERVRELAVRSALGAGRWRIVRQLLFESLALGLCAALAGVGVAWVVVRLMISFALPGGIELSGLNLSIDDTVLGFTVVVSALCGVGFGLAPAIGSARSDLMRALREAAQVGRRHGWRAGNVLVSMQVALSLILLVSGFLFLRSLQRALEVDLGYHTRGVATVAVGLRQHGYTPESAVPFVRSVLDGVRARPGVMQVAATARVPIEDESVRLPVIVEGSEMGSSPRMALVPISPEYLEVMGIPIFEGRGVEWTDTDETQRVAVVTESAAATLWPGQPAIGRQFVAMFGEPYTVVGVARDGHYTRLTEKEPHVFLPLEQGMGLAVMDRLRFVARGAESTQVLSTLRAVVRSVDPGLPTFEERDVTEQLEMVLMPQRFGMRLLTALGSLALLISAVGIYAVAAFDVARRRRELGIRAALGAGRTHLIGIVVGRAGTSVLVGAAAGLLAATVLTRFLESFLFGIGNVEPLAYIAATLCMTVGAIAATWIPARRAARMDPVAIMHD
jgi:predicted permease